MNTISAVFTDLDGTLFKSDKTVSQFTIDMLVKCRNKGIPVIIATARPERVVATYKELSMASALITLNGACIKLPNNKVLSYGFKHDEGIALLKKYLEHKNLSITVETSAGIYGNVSIPEWGITGRDDFVNVIAKEDLYKILISSQDKNICIEDVVSQTIKSLGLDESVYYSVAEGWLYQIMSRNTTKWNGAKAVLRELGVEPEAAIYFGDDNDDLECVSNMGLGVAMGNGVESVLKAAKEIAPTNDEDGVGVTLQKYLLM